MHLPQNEITDSYFAGLIDGDGCVRISVQKGRISPRPSIAVTATCESTISALKNYFGGSAYTKKTPEHQKPQWRWMVSALQAREVARRIHPYAITKKEQLAKILELPITPRGRPRISK